MAKVSDSVVLGSRVPSLTWSPDGRCLAFVAVGPTWEDALSFSMLDVDTGWQVYLTSDVLHPVWSPDGSRIAFIFNGNLWVMNTDGSEQTRLTNPSQPFVQEPAWLPDGSGLLFAFTPTMASSVYLMNPDGSGEVNVADGYGPVFSPDGNRIAFYGGGIFAGMGSSPDLYVMDRDGRSPIKVAQEEYTDVIAPCRGGGGPAWSPDGRFLAHGGSAHGVEIVASDASAPARQVGWGGPPSWAPDGRRLAFTSAGGLGSPWSGCTVTLFDLETGQVSFLAQGESSSWSPDGQRIAFLGTETAGGGDVYVINVDGTGLRKLLGIVGYRLPLAWSPDGTRLAVVTNGLYVVDVASGESTKLAEKAEYAPSWSPDGTQLAFSVGYDPTSPATTIYIVSADGSGGPRKLTDESGEWASGPSWSPDGTRIAFAR